MNKNDYLNDFDETLRSSMKKASQKPFKFDYSLLEQPIKRKKPLYLLPVVTGVVAVIVCISIIFSSVFRNTPPALITMENPSSVDSQTSQDEQSSETVSAESNNKATSSISLPKETSSDNNAGNSNKNQSVSLPKENSSSTSSTVKTAAIPKWYAPASLQVTTLASAQKGGGTGYSARFIYFNDLYDRPGHSGCNAPRFDITTGEVSCVNHEIYEAVKGKLTQFTSPKNIYVFADVSNDKNAVFTDGVAKEQGENMTWPDFYIYFFETKTFIKSPYPLNDGFLTFSSDGTKYLAVSNGNGDLGPVFYDLFIYDIKKKTSINISIDDKGKRISYPSSVRFFSQNARYVSYHTHWWDNYPNGRRENRYAIYDVNTKKTVMLDGSGKFSGNSEYYLHVDNNTLYRYQLESGRSEKICVLPGIKTVYVAGYNGRVAVLSDLDFAYQGVDFRVVKDGVVIKQKVNARAYIADPQSKYFYWYEGTNDYISVMSMENGETFEILLPGDGYNEMMSRISGGAIMSLYVSTDGKNLALEYYGF